MADSDFNNQAIYHQQGGDELVVADGGSLTVESGGAQTIESGGKITHESGGEFEFQSGSFFDMQGGSSFYLASSSNTLTASQMRALLWNPTTFSVIQESTGAGSGVLSTINLPSAGFIIFSMSDAASNASAWMTSMTGIPGQRMILFIRGGQSQASVYISMSGVSVVGTLSGDLSSFSLQQSATAVSQGFVELLCTAADEWSIVDLRGQVVQRGSS